MAPYIMLGWFFLTTVYVAILYRFRDSYEVFGLTPSPDFCRHVNGGRVCNRTDLFAFQIASGIALTTCALVGFHAWHISKRAHTALPATPEGRLCGYLPEAELLAALNFTFQSWDFCISLLIPEHGTAIMLSHHLMAATVSWCSVQYQYLHYYGIFFLGITEVSSIFLVFLDLSKYYPPQPSSAVYDAIVTLCGPLFVFTFLYYRVVVWWPESYRLLTDVRAVTRSGRAEELRPGASWVLYLYLALNLPLGLLQLFWTTVIANEVRDTLQPDQIAL